MEFEIINIQQEHSRFTVEIEVSDTRERKRFGYPMGDGWETEINGELKFLKDIKQKLKDEEDLKKTKMDFTQFDKLKGKKIKP